MIQDLIQALATLLQSNVSGVTIQHTLIDALPLADQLQTLTRYLTELQTNQSFRDHPVDHSPQSLPATQLVACSQRRRPSLLDHVSLPGTLLVQTGPKAEDTAQPLAAGTDVTLDTQAILASLPVAITLTAMRESQGALHWLRRLSVDVIKQKHQVETLQRSNAALERRLEERTAELRTANEQLRRQNIEIQLLKQQPQAENHSLREESKDARDVDGIVGQSDVLKTVLFRAEQVASSDTTVLLLGETGVGKELIARAIHQWSPRHARPLVTVNCAALSHQLIESELFGHEKGAFTGAAAKRVGRFETAHSGTLFLDEVGELPLELQAKLLRVLQDGEFERVGSSRTISVDVRVIAATNRDLEDDVRRGRFRQDLYYRLAVFPITVPALRDRREDIPLLVRFFVERFARKASKTIHTVPAGAMEALQCYAWPGNVRELQNVIERAVINTQGPSLRLMDTLRAPGGLGLGSPHIQTLTESEVQCIVRALEETHWKIEGKDGAATALDLPASTLRKRLRKLGIQRPATFRSIG